MSHISYTRVLLYIICSRIWYAADQELHTAFPKMERRSEYKKDCWVTGDVWWMIAGRSLLSLLNSFGMATKWHSCIQGEVVHRFCMLWLAWMSIFRSFFWYKTEIVLRVGKQRSSRHTSRDSSFRKTSNCRLRCKVVYSQHCNCICNTNNRGIKIWVISRRCCVVSSENKKLYCTRDCTVLT